MKMSLEAVRAHQAKHGFRDPLAPTEAEKLAGTLQKPSGGTKLAPERLNLPPQGVSGTSGSGKAPPKPRRSKSKNRTENEYELMLRAKFPGCEIRWEAYTLRMASRATYTPDFSVKHPGGRIEFHEVKGAYVFPKALVKLRIAAEMFDHRFVLAQKRKEGWEIAELPGRYRRD